jgi:lipid-binding SYLF domain-containing protein
MTSMLLVSALALANGSLWAGTGLQDSIDRLRISSEVIHASLDAPDKGIPDEVLSGAKCIVVIPHLVKGGFIFGAEHGRGVASCRTSEGWSAPDEDSTRAIYGREVSFRSILSGDIQAPKSSLDFMKAIADAGHAGTVAEVGTEQK